MSFSDHSSIQFDAPDPAELAALFPGYEIHHLIATGGMGAVYLAVQKSLERSVAIKILPHEFSEDPAFREAFEAEAKAMGRLNHPNLIGVYDFGEVNGMLYIIMEYVPGKSLFHSSHCLAIDAREVIRLVTGICLGLAHAHQHGIIHRDIKPSNILLDSQAKPKIGDFGLARSMERKTEEGEEIFGTPEYTAPEVCAAPCSVNYRADLYSVGILLHELLTGQLPVKDPRPASLMIGCDVRFDAIIRRATDPIPERRYASADEIARDLQAIASSVGRGGPKAPAAGAARRQARKPLEQGKSGNTGTVISVIGLVVACLLAYQFMKPQPLRVVAAPPTHDPVPLPEPEPQPEPPALPEPPPTPKPPEPKPPPATDVRPNPNNERVVPATAIAWGSAAGEWTDTTDKVSFTVRSGDLYNSADDALFRCQSWIGDGEFMTHISHMSGRNGWAKAGLMIRAGTSAGSRHALMDCTISGKMGFRFRPQDGAPTNGTNMDGAREWVRLMRQGNRITGSMSDDRIHWTTVGSAVFPDLPEKVLVGYAVSSWSANAPLTGTFSPIEFPKPGQAGHGFVAPNVKPVFDVAGFLAKGRKVLQERVNGLVTKHQAAIKSNYYGFEGILQHRAAPAIRGEVKDALTSLRAQGNRIPDYLDDPLSDVTGAADEHAAALKKQADLDNTLQRDLAAFAPSYIQGLRKQLERLGKDPGAVALIEEEIAKVDNDPEYFASLMKKTD